ncbi:MAG TPA: ribosome small subunit-dependent GTPase A, partial [Nannocystis exedens]|nr:ribosome small subunit-dependent GTPase A [Nannocystis exedens]
MSGEEITPELAELGWDRRWQEVVSDCDVGPVVTPARVVVVYQDRLAVRGPAGLRFAELRGRLRRRQSRERLAIPASGDWVLIAENKGGGMATVEALLPRRTCLIRRAAGRRILPQVVAANIDTVFVVTSPNRDFNTRRVERYLTAIADGGAAAAVLLNKIDLVEDPERWLAELRTLGGAPVYGLSATQGQGLELLGAHLGRGRTVAFVGSSGVGKSSLINRLLGADRQVVAAIREEDDKGRHTTTHRELLPIDGGAGGMVIDTPGMRELQIWSEGASVRETF